MQFGPPGSSWPVAWNGVEKRKTKERVNLVSSSIFIVFPFLLEETEMEGC